MTVRFWYPVMRRGVIEFARPEDCPVARPAREMACKPFGEVYGNFSSVEDCEKEAE